MKGLPLRRRGLAKAGRRKVRDERDERTKVPKLTRNTGHDSRKSSSELFWLLHTLVDGKNESDPLEGEDGGSGDGKKTSQDLAPVRTTSEQLDSPDKKGVFSRVEELNVGNSRGGENRYFVRGDVDD